MLFYLVFAFCADAQQAGGVSQQEAKAAELVASDHTSEAIEIYTREAQNYWNRQDFANAIRVYEILLDISKKINNQNSVYFISNNLGLLYSNLGDYGKSLSSFLLALEISKRLKAPYEIVSCQINVALTLQNAGNFEGSFPYLNEVLPKVTEIGDLKMLRRVYGLIAQCYEKKGESQKAFEFFEKYAAIDKQVKKTEMEAVQKDAARRVYDANLQTMETRSILSKTSVELEKTADSLKEAERVSHDRKMQIDLRNLQLREKENQIKFEQKTRRFLFLGFIVISAFLVVVVLLLLDRVRANKILNLKNSEIEKQKNEISKQKERLELQNKNITSSITYAQTIQSASLPDQNIMCQYLDFSVLYRPKDIVSGDFYWFHPVSEDKCFVAVVDCTGHGVPGAFMSLIGVQLLNEIIIQEEIHSPSLILSALNQSLFKVLKQDISENEDGMDVCLCRFDRTEHGAKITFAGAKRPLYLLSSSTGSVDVIDGSSFSTGGRYAKKADVEYVEKELNVMKNDIVVLTSDGAIDQPGPTRKRYGSIRLIDSLKKGDASKAATREMIDMLSADFDAYTAGEEQRDDLTVVIIKC